MAGSNEAMPDALRQAHEAMQGGRPADALNLIQVYLATTPDDVGALNLAGLAQLTLGQPAAAADLLGKAVALDPAHVESLTHLGIAKLSTGQPDEGVRLLEQAVGQRAGYLPAQFNLGLAYLSTGRARDAVASFRRVTKADARNAGAWLNLGVAQVSAEMNDQAQESFRTASRLAPSDPVPARNLANLLVEKDAPADALPIYERLLERDRTDLVALLGLAAAKEKLGAREEAIELYEEVLAADIDNLAAHINVAPQLERFGRFDEAEPHFRRAVELDEGRPESLHNLIGFLIRTRQNDAVGPLCETGAERFPDDSYFLERLAGHMFRRLGDSAAGRAVLDRLLERFPDNVTGFELRVADPEGALSAADLARLSARIDHGADDAETIGRLGFVLFEHWHRQGDHPKAFAFLQKANASIYGTYRHKPNDDTLLTARTIKTFDKRFFDERRDWGDPTARPIFIVGMPRSATTVVEQIFSQHSAVAALGELRDVGEISEDLALASASTRGYPRALTGITEANLRAAAKRYLGVTDGLSQGAQHFTDKMPANFRYLGLIGTLFPNAKVVHCRRDAMDVCFSIYRHNFHGTHGYAFDMAALANYHRQYQRLMEHWAEVCPIQIHDVDYDGLVDDLEGTVRGMLEYCGLPFETACLDFHQSTRGADTASWAQVRRPIFRDSIGAWRAYEEELAPLAKALAKRT
jgi:tetratricopeptide (TPR) repeat protein